MVPLRRATVRGRSIAYRRAGRGAPVVLLHGFACDSRLWHPQLDDLADGFDVIAWDAIGAGASDDAPDSYTLEDWSADLAGLLDALGIERADVVGMSWGGLLAQELYRRGPDRVRSLVLAGTYAGWRGSLGATVAEQRLASAQVDADLAPAAFVERYLPGMFGRRPPPEARRRMASVLGAFHPRGFRLMAAAVAEADTRDLLPTIAVPTLLVWGEDDARSPVAVGEAFHEAIEGSSFVIVPTAGHVVNLDRPREFNAAVRGFLTALG